MDWIHSKYSFQNQFIINADVCRADNPNYGRYNAIFEIESENFDSLTPPKDCLYTILPFFASDGYIWFVLFVFKGKENKDGVMNKTRGTFTIYYAVTDSGFVNDELWNDVCNIFLQHLKPHQNGANALLIIDNCSVHTSVDTLFELYQSNIITVFLPPHSTNWSQPLDNGCFTPLKVLTKKMYRKKKTLLLNGGQSKNIIGEIIVDAISFSMTKKVISKAFETTKLSPWDRKGFLQNYGNFIGENYPKRSTTLQQTEIQKMTKVSINMINKEANTNQGNVRNIKMVSRKNTSYTPQKMVNQNKELMEEVDKKRKKRKERAEDEERIREERKNARMKKEESRDAKLIDRARRKCKGDCGKTYFRRKSWHHCTMCNEYYVCISCIAKENILLIHVEECTAFQNDKNSEEITNTPN